MLTIRSRTLLSSTFAPVDPLKSDCEACNFSSQSQFYPDGLILPIKATALKQRRIDRSDKNRDSHCVPETRFTGLNVSSENNQREIELSFLWIDNRQVKLVTRYIVSAKRLQYGWYNGSFEKKKKNKGTSSRYKVNFPNILYPRNGFSPEG